MNKGVLAVPHTNEKKILFSELMPFNTVPDKSDMSLEIRKLKAPKVLYLVQSINSEKVIKNTDLVNHHLFWGFSI